MNPIFKEYIKFLKDSGIETEKYNLKEGYYWLDKQIIKAYDTNGNIHKIIRLFVDNNSNTSLKTVYKNNNFILESWKDTIERERERVLKLEEESIKLIKENILNNENYNLIKLTSGGKDSTVTSYLVEKSKKELNYNKKINSIFNNTTLDCSDTHKYILKQTDVEIINPKEGFYQWRKRLNFIGNRTSRACCTIFKEGAMINVLNKKEKFLFFMGMRNEESNTRSSYEDRWVNKKWINRDWFAILPIRKWTEIDVWLYILMNNIDFNTKYKKGYARVGCAIACPFYTKSTWTLDKYWYPSMYKRWHKILEEDFLKNNKDLIMNCTQKEYHNCWNGGIYRKEPTEEVILEYANRSNLEKDIAKKYFSHTCESCNKKIKDKNVLAMNMKFHGRNINNFYCKEHLKEKLNITEEDWNKNIKLFKIQGCDLF